MAHRLERYDCHAVCDDYRDDPSAGCGRLSAVSVKGHWWCAWIHSDRRIDLLVRSFKGEIERKSQIGGLDFPPLSVTVPLDCFSRPQDPNLGRRIAIGWRAKP